MRDGYEVQVVADGGGSPGVMADDIALRRMEKGGVKLFEATSGSCGCEPYLSRPLIVRIGLNPQPKADVPRHLRSYGDLVLVRGKSVLAINLS